MDVADFLIVGSGCTGAMAAETLAATGSSVVLIDGGIDDKGAGERIPHVPYHQLRKQEESQHEFLLGKKFESIPSGKTGTGAQLTPARMFLIEKTAEWIPLLSETFKPIESLAVGGLGGGWGLGCCVFSEAELQAAGLNAQRMKRAYQVVADRIGISGNNDDARPFTSAHISGVQPAFEPGHQAKHLLKKYESKKASLNRNGFYLGRPALALLTQDKGSRKALERRDMDFYDDHNHSAWRAWMTVQEVVKRPNVKHEKGWLVVSFAEQENAVEATALNLETSERKIFKARKLILSGGPLATARIVLRSMTGGMQKQLPLLCNPYNYTPFLIPRLLGNAIPDDHIGFAQLSLFHSANAEHNDIAMASLYSYNALMLFRLLRETPLNFRDGRIAMKYLLPALIIGGIHHPETSGTGQFVALRSDSNSKTGDILTAEYNRTEEKDRRVTEREVQYRKAMRSLGAYALKQVQPGHGASVHYAGVLPFSKKEEAFHLASDGRLHGFNRVFVADGSGFKYLPAKGLTLSLMANAHDVALNASQ
ncbi:MAG: hypothetical protein RL007_521 [Bacteroidota bacterium]|jgi:hypothetical protein